MFHFNYRKFDFWPVYDSIKRYYPLGIPKDESRMYMNYPGLKDLEKIIIENIHDEHHYLDRWEGFEKTVEYQTQKIVTGTTYGQTPCFSSFIELDRISMDNLTRIRELHFFVSLIGPFYTVLGVDRSEITPGEDRIDVTNYLTLSPEHEYREFFDLVCQLTEEKFRGFRFIPHEIYSQRLEGLDIRYANEKLDTVFNALFNNQVDLQAKTVGSGFYKSEDWIREGYDPNSDKGWTSSPRRGPSHR